MARIASDPCSAINKPIAGKHPLLCAELKVYYRTSGFMRMNDNCHRPFKLVTRCAAAFWAAALLFFLLYSAPHSVHHFFEQHATTGHDGSADHHGKGQQNKSANSSDCVFQVSVSRCALGLTAQLQSFDPIRLIRDLVIDKDAHRHTLFFSSTFRIRAPPTA
jgi:hypothetical protein